MRRTPTGCLTSGPRKPSRRSSPMHEVGVVDQFEAAHMLRGNFGPATRRHGHTYKVELVVRGDTLQDDGTLCDIGVLQAALKRAVGELNYRELDCMTAFAHKNSTA